MVQERIDLLSMAE